MDELKTVLLDLDVIEARAAAATPGPWDWYRHELRPLPLPEPDEDGYRDFDGASAIVETDGGYYGPNEADRAFIAAARTDVPALVAEVRALRAAIERGRAFADNMEDIGKRLAVKHGTADAEAAKVLSDQLRAELAMG